MNRTAFRSILVPCLALTAAGLAPAALAQQATTTMAVSASIAANCLVDTTPMTFGAYDPVAANSSTGADLDAVATLGLTCTQGSSATVTMGNGNAFSTGNRRMASAQASAFMTYQLYSDAARTVAWPATGVSYVGTGVRDTSVQVYGRVPRAQNLPAAADYSDSVVVTVAF
jgi:spore coat protein U-like protein